MNWVIDLTIRNYIITDAYYYENAQNKTLFAFESEGAQGTVLKLVLFQLTDTGKWNLAFGDWIDNDLNDKVITNNQDAIKVIKTVAKIAIEFLRENPDRIVVIDPVDEKRKRLYNLAFQRHFTEIEPIMHVIAFIDGIEEIYTPFKMYDKFEISLKS